MIRPDLTYRTALSKSELVGADLCQTRAWFGRHFPRPLPPKEEITFGAAVDAGVEIIVGFLRSEQPVQPDRAYAAAAAIVERDQVEIEGGFSAIERALDGFAADVAPRFDWSYALTQHHIGLQIEGWGDCDGHPDLVLHDGTVLDVKTGKRAKPTARTLELGFYALLREVETGDRPKAVGYLTWVRTSKPTWQILLAEVDDDLIAWTRARADAYVRARDLDARLNEGAAEPVNATLTAGPKFDALCADCAWTDLCPIRVSGGATDVAA